MDHLLFVTKVPDIPCAIELDKCGKIAKLTHWYKIGDSWTLFEVWPIRGGFASKQGSLDGPATNLRGTLTDVTTSYVFADDLPRLFVTQSPTQQKLEEIGFGGFTIVHQQRMAA